MKQWNVVTNSGTADKIGLAGLNLNNLKLKVKLLLYHLGPVQ